MPYELRFTAAIHESDPSRYINECCRGGDVIRDRLLPAVAQCYQQIETEQEDWGWFIWFRDGGVRLAVDIFCDDPQGGAFRTRLTSRRKTFFGSKVVDTPELERLRDVVAAAMDEWAKGLRIDRVDD